MRKKVIEMLAVIFGLLVMLLIFSAMMLLGLLTWKGIITLWGGLFG